MSLTTTQQRTALEPTNLNEAMRFADMLAASSMVPRDYQGKPANVLVAMQWGREVGLGPLQALQNIAVINGRPSIWGDAALALVRGHPACAGISEGVEGEGDQRAGWCEVTRRGEKPQRRLFSVADAKKAGLWGKQGPWQQYPDRMLQLRARGFAIRDVFPDALRGVITAEEAQDMPADPREVRAEVVQPAVKPGGMVDHLRQQQGHAPAEAAPAEEGLPLVSPDGDLITLRASSKTGAPVIVVWAKACERAIARMESPAALRKWAAENEPHFVAVASAGFADDVDVVRALIEDTINAPAPA